MNKTELIITFFMIALFSFTCQRKVVKQPSFYTPDHQYIHYTGRIDFSNTKKPRLSGAAAYFKFKFTGTNCDILLEDQNLYHTNHNYISIEVDGNYQGRIRVNKDQTTYRIVDNLKDTDHTILVCKATEAQIGYIDFWGISCDQILPLENKLERKIEFIGNSITCGQGIDISEIPCDSAEWYDQHDAYLAYGPLIARELDADWLLSSVSGIGMTRNWNSPGPTLPQVYDHMFLNTDSTLLWDIQTYIPDLVSICLGTNDFCDGDGSYDRRELDSAQFISDYIQFVKHIRNRYPQAQICCLTSPILTGEDKGTNLLNYLTTVIRHMKKIENDTKIHMFTFSRAHNNGCLGHPSKEDHQMMAEELLPFYRKIMDW